MANQGHNIAYPVQHKAHSSAFCLSALQLVMKSSSTSRSGSSPLRSPILYLQRKHGMWFKAVLGQLQEAPSLQLNLPGLAHIDDLWQLSRGASGQASYFRIILALCYAALCITRQQH